MNDRKTAVYYPTMDISDARSLRQCVLFWDEFKTIVPSEIGDPFKARESRICRQEGFLAPLHCDLRSSLLEEVGETFVQLLKLRQGHLLSATGMDAVRSQYDWPTGIEYYFADREPSKQEIRQLFESGALVPLANPKFGPQFADELRRLGLDFAEKIDAKRIDYMNAEIGAYNSTETSIRLGSVLLPRSVADSYMTALAARLAEAEEAEVFTDSRAAFASNVAVRDVKTHHPPDSAEVPSVGQVLSVTMQDIHVDPDVPIEKLIRFRRKNEQHLLDLRRSIQAMLTPTVDEAAREAADRAQVLFERNVRPAMEKLRKELQDSAIGSLWEGIQRAVTLSVPAGGVLAATTGWSGATLVTAGLAITVADVAVKSSLAKRRILRGNAISYLSMLESSYGLPPWSRA